MSMIMLMCKLIILLIGKHNNASCFLIEFTLKWCPTCCEWLNACVAIERMVAVKRATKFSASTSRRAAKYVTPSVTIFIALACSFELIFRRIIIDTYDNKAWCVLTLNRDRPILLALYSISNIFLYLVPLTINLTSCIIIIIGTFRSKQKATSNAPAVMSKESKNLRKQNWKSIKEHIKKYKHILIATILLGLLAVPRVVITFIYVCTKLDRSPFLFWLVISSDFCHQYLYFLLLFYQHEIIEKLLSRVPNTLYLNVLESLSPIVDKILN